MFAVAEEEEAVASVVGRDVVTTEAKRDPPVAEVGDGVVLYKVDCVIVGEEDGAFLRGSEDRTTDAGGGWATSFGKRVRAAL